MLDGGGGSIKLATTALSALMTRWAASRKGRERIEACDQTTTPAPLERTKEADPLGGPARRSLLHWHETTRIERAYDARVSSLDNTESGFDRWRARAGFVGAPILAASIVALGDGTPATTLAALFAWTAVWWISEAIHPGATALLAVAASVALGLASPKEAFGALGRVISAG